MKPQSGAHRLGLFSSHHASAQPRGRDGRFVRVRLTSERRAILERAAKMRSELGLPPLTVLELRREDRH